MRILVTGANGYLGQGIVEQLLNDKHDVIATDYESKFIDSRADIKCCNLFSIENPYEYFGRPDVVLHLAWRDGFVHNSLSHIDDLPLHVKFIKGLCESGIKQMCVMGSMHEIGFYEGSINEDTICNPLSFYGIGKDALRKLTKNITKSNNVVFQWLRGFYIVGNSEHGSSIFSKICKAEKTGQKEFPFTMGQNQFDFIEYNKFCLLVARTVEQSKINGIINICEGKPEKIAERVERYITDNKYKIKLKYGAFPDRDYDSKAVWGDASKIALIMKRWEDNHGNNVDFT